MTVAESVWLPVQPLDFAPAALTEVNPFQDLPGLYSEAKQKFYRDRSAAAGG